MSLSERVSQSSVSALYTAVGSGIFDRARFLWWGLIGIIFVTGLVVRLYDLSAPPVDFHPTRQLHSALIARGMFYESQPTFPTWQRAMAVSQWRTEGLIEPQVFERLTAITYSLMGNADLRIPRLYAVAFWLTAAVFTALLANRIAGKGGALATALFFLAWPYGVIASRAFQPEPLFIALMAAGLWAALRWEDHSGWGWTAAAGLLCGLAVYIKAVAVFFVAPALIVLILARGGLRQAVRDSRVWVLGLLFVLPYAIYHIDGVYLRRYLVDQFTMRFFPEMWIDPAFYLRWLSNLERVVPIELVLVAFLGLFAIRRPLYRWMLLAMWLGYLLYGMTLPHHISTHDYYHLPLFPQIALGVAGAAEALFNQLRGPRRVVQAAICVALLVALLLNGYEARNLIKRSGAHALAQAWSDIGLELGEGASAAGLVNDYGVGLKYYAWVNPQIWPTAADIRFRESSGQSFDFASFFAEQGKDRDFFIVQPPSELDLQPQLKELLYRRYPLAAQSPEYLIFDLRAGEE